MSDTFQKRVLLVAAAWNILGGVGALLDPSHHFAQMYRGSLQLDDPVQMFFFRTVWIAVMAWGLAYLAAALRRPARAVVQLTGSAGKIAYAAAATALVLEGAGAPALLLVALADAFFAALFIAGAWSGFPARDRRQLQTA